MSLRSIDLSALNPKVREGLDYFCDLCKLPKLGGVVSEQLLKYFIFILRERRDLPVTFPLGKDATIHLLLELLTIKEIKNPLDREKVAAACEAGERVAGWVRINISRWTKEGEWEIKIEVDNIGPTDKQQVIKDVLSLASRIKRRKGWEGNIIGEAEFRGVPIKITSVGKCEVTYEEKEVEEEEIIKTGKKIKVKKKVAVYNCSDSDITKKKSGKRRVAT